MSQYIPIAFFAQALPVFFRQRGVALNVIGCAIRLVET
ncbi:hypothetical protein H1P_5790001 [Hyella patelloides LEGE 07179]|uniref:Uncharacterized protein n=1 Tax=Hyella patelloides LEGE 07179 TaxID=945734 RepID=A0A563W0P7_9CYAN|nr:hypothetical protein H1P_5790001 [Hyella patelloides LEGE 07179]